MRSKPSAMRVSRLLPRGSCAAQGPLQLPDSAEMLSGNSDLNEKLRQRLEQAESERSRARDAMRAHAAQLSQYNQVLASLKSSYDTKKELLNDLYKELQDIGVRADTGAKSVLARVAMSCTCS